MKQTSDNDIDLFELLKILWCGRWLITCFFAFSTAISGGFLLLSEARYESKIYIKIQNDVTSKNDARILQEFESLFYTPDIFNGWAKDSGSNLITFENISRTEIFDGFEFSKDYEDLQAVSNPTVFLVRSKKPEVINGYFDYLHYVEKIFKSEYILEAKHLRNMIEKRLNENISKTLNATILQDIIRLDTAIASTEGGQPVILFTPPTIPEKMYPKTLITMALGTTIGLMIGIALVLLRHSIAQRQLLIGEND